MDKAHYPIGRSYIATALKCSSFSFDIIDIDANRYLDQEVEGMLSKNGLDVIAFGTLASGYKYGYKYAVVSYAVKDDIG